VTLKTKAHIYHATVKSTITYAAETWCLKAKTVAKLNSTEMDFWRRSARISRKDKIRNTIIKQKMNVTRSLLEDIKTQHLKWYGHVQRMEEGRLPKKVMKWSPPGMVNIVIVIITCLRISTYFSKYMSHLYKKTEKLVSVTEAQIIGLMQ